jgi:hypothetical protein
MLSNLDKGRKQLQLEKKSQNIQRSSGFSSASSRTLLPLIPKASTSKVDYDPKPSSKRSIKPESIHKPSTSHQTSHDLARASPQPLATTFGSNRNEDLTLIEDLPIGPVTYTPPSHDPLFNSYEPNSGISLCSRIISHDDIQSHLTGRYIVSPSALYSIVRKGKGNDWDVPVEGDWVCIGVLADKGETRWTKGGRGEKWKELDGEEEKKERGKGKEKMVDEEDYGLGKSEDEEQAKAKSIQKPSFNSPKRYINFKLLDLRLPNAGGGSGVLNLIVFESNSTVKRKIDFEDGDEEVYAYNNAKERGDSEGNAYDKLWKERNGSVVAFLNPRVMRSRDVSYHLEIYFEISFLVLSCSRPNQIRPAIS